MAFAHDIYDGSVLAAGGASCHEIIHSYSLTCPQIYEDEQVNGNSDNDEDNGTDGMTNEGVEDGTVSEAHNADPTLEPKITCLSFSPNDDVYATGADDGTMQIWDIKTSVGKPLAGHSQSVNCIPFSSHDQYIVSGSIDQSVHL